MKRSEMVELIFEAMERERPVTASKVMANLALTVAESYGMLPPAIKATHGFMADEYGMTNEWEDQ